MVLIPDYDQEKAEELKSSIEHTLQKMSDTHSSGFQIEASIGYVIADRSFSSLNDCINEADEKMYRLKRARNAERVDAPL